MREQQRGSSRWVFIAAGLALIWVSWPSSGQTPGVPVAVREVPRAGNVEPAVVQVVDGKATAVPRPSWTRSWATYTSVNLPVGSDLYLDLMAVTSFGGSFGPFFDPRTPEPDEFNWSPFNLGLLESAVPGDFLPVGSTIHEDSVALSPAIGSDEPTGWNGLRRATLHGAVDLVTGVPLVQVTDLVLPVGGAEFRLNRTRSANRLLTGKTYLNEVGVSPAESRWWDWVGSGWMMSENPILLIDSRLPDVVGDSEPRTTLWLDALHSIPFDWVSTKEEGPAAGSPFGRSYGMYDAAPRYRAKLRALKDGISSDQTTHASAPRRIGAETQAPGQPAAGDWMPGFYPDRYEVSLYDGALIYEFEPEWEDVPSWQYWWPPADQRTSAPINDQIRYSSAHGRPLLPSSSGADVPPDDSRALAYQNLHPWKPTPQNQAAPAGRSGRGVGMPYYALLKSIRDRQGNRVEIEYADVLEWDDQGHRIQQTSMKGAVSRIKVFAAGATTPKWTLLYAYRLIPRAGDRVAGPYNGVSTSNMVNAIVPLSPEASYLSTGENGLAAQWPSFSAAKKYVWSDPALETIYVFEGEVDNRRITLMRPPEESLWSPQASAPHRWPTDTDDLLKRYQDGEAAALGINQSGPPGSPGGNDIMHRADWKFRVRYSYASTDLPNGERDGGTGIPTAPNSGVTYAGIRSMPTLVRTETQMRPDSANAALRSLQNLVYQYEREAPFHTSRWLHSVFDDRGLRRIHSEVRANPPATLEETIVDLASGKTGADIDAARSMGFASGRSAKDFRDAARWWFGNAGFRGSSPNWSSSGESLVSYQSPGSPEAGQFARPSLSALSSDRIIPNDPNEYWADGVNGTVAAFSTTDPMDGRRRYFRISRLIRGPEAFAACVSTDNFKPEPDFPFDGERAWRSIFSNPFKWQTYASGHKFRWPTMRGPLEWREFDTEGNPQSESHASTEVDYARHRWVVIIDEFPTWDDARSAGPATIITSSGSKSSFFQTMLERRVVGLNPQGNVLWEKTFTLRNGQFVEGGDTGLNESYVYISGEQLIQSIDSTVDVSKLDESVASERFLVQKRSVGWSAAALSVNEPNTTPTDQRRVAGLVWNYHYADVSDTPKPMDSSGNRVPEGLSWGERLKPVGESIQNGNVSSDSAVIPYDSASLRWTAQTFYLASDPTVVLGSAQITAPRSDRFPATGGDGGLAAALESPEAIVTRSITKRFPDNQTGPYDKVLTMSISPPRQTRMGGPLFYDVNLSVSNAKGLTVWSVAAFLPLTGTQPDPMSLTSGSDPDKRVQLTYYRYDDYGRNLETIVDVERNSGWVDAADRSLLPESLDRVTCAGGPPPAEHRTVRRYSDEDGLMDVIQPNGRRWSRRVCFGVENTDASFNQGKPFDRIYTFNDLIPQGAQGTWELPSGTFDAAGVAFTKDYDSYKPPSRFLSRSGSGESTGGQMLRQQQARVTSPVVLTAYSLGALPTLEPLAQAAMSYDSAGRPVEAKSLERTANGTVQSSSATVRDDGDRVTTTEWDGTLTRRIRNARGQLVRTYIGTSATNATTDWNSQWPTSPNPDPTETGVDGFDMLLRERVEYGSGPTDALQPIRKWTYVQNPPWTSDQLAAFGSAPDGDGHGELTYTRYDWRMRPVRVDVLGPALSGARPVLSSRVTFLDHADRPVLEATYSEATPPASVDPSVAAPFSVTPSAATILSDSTAPTSLTETIYFSDGSVKERRTYRTPATGYTYTGSPQFHAERYFYGMGGKQTFVERPESPIQLSVLDNLGRQVREATVLPRTVSNTTQYDFELTRTDYRFDPECNIVLTDRWERLAAPTTAADLAASGAQALTSANAALTRTETWYDHAKRVLTVREWGDHTAAFGSQTFGSLDSVVHSPNPGQAPRISVNLATNPPTVLMLSPPSDTSGRWTYHAYDTSGQKIATRAPDGKLSTFSYDTKGQLIREVVNAADSDPAKRTHTRHAYWLGRSISTSTVRTAGNEQTRQFQGVAYGAQVVGISSTAVSGSPNFTYISNSNALVGAMMSCNPDLTPLDGYTVDTVPSSPAAEQLKDYIQSIQDFQFACPDFAYRYYADGLIAERVDKRGVAIRYFYDNQRRLKEQEVWNYSGPTYTTGEVPVNAPTPQPTDRNIWRLENAVPGYPGWMGIPKNGTGGVDQPVDRIGYIAYSYDSRGNVERVKAKTARNATVNNQEAIVAETKYLYDDRNNLIKEIQSHGGSADALGVPFIDYTRQYTAGASTASTFFAGRDRLLSMTYPSHAGYSGPRTVSFDYGNVAGLDALIDRPSSYNMGSSRVAAFTYSGSGRRVSTSLGGTATTPWVTQTFDTNPATPGLEGLDAMGRVRDLHYRIAVASPSTLWRGQHGYDINGNRLYERLTQRAPSQATVGVMAGVGGDNTRSRRFFYDEMDRLTSAESGALSADNATIGSSAAYPGLGAGALPTGRRRESWGLDKLGNWSANNPEHERTYNVCGVSVPQGTIRGYGPGDQTIVPEEPPVPGSLSAGRPAGHRVQVVDAANASTDQVYEAHLTADFDPAATHSDQRALNSTRWVYSKTNTGEDAWVRHITDANGNLIYDGKYFYQYDAWNRLIQVNDASAMRWWAFHSQGVKMGVPYLPNMAQLPSFCESPFIGWTLKHFNYDGVGRLYRTMSPLKPPDGYFFQIVNPNPPPPPPATQPPYLYVTTLNRSERFFYDGTRRIQELITDPLLYNEDHDIITMANELYAGQPGGGGSNVIAAGAPYVRAMYVWGPGDSPTSGVDELLLQIDPRDTGPGAVSAFGGKPWFAVSDAQGDLVALLHKQSASATVQIAAQWTYTPYGEVLTYEQFHPHPVVVFGHKSLVVDRLDTQAVSWETNLGTISDTQRLIPGATLIAYARNRTYSPGLGRWLQQDPNASGIPVISLAAFHGTELEFPSISVDLENRARDGSSLSQYLRSSPIANRDPLGLFLLLDLLPSSTNAAGLQSDWSQRVTEFGQDIKSMARGLFDAGALQQAMDFEWALDWSAPDDFYAQQQRGGEDRGVSDQPEYAMAGVVSTAGRIVEGNLRTVGHHIATRYGRWGADAAAIFRSAGMGINDAANKLPVLAIYHWRKGQRGHNERYKDMVINRLWNAVERFPIEQVENRAKALKEELAKLAEEITKNPRMINWGP